MGQNEVTIDLADHENPKDFMERCQKKYPDENVSFSLTEDGKKMTVGVVENVPTQMKISIFSFLGDLAQHEMSISR